MAQSGSCPNPDLSNSAIVHSPLDICSDQDTQRGREDEEGEEEDEEVELAEEVAEDVLMMAEAGEWQAEKESESGAQGEREDMRIIEVSLLPNGEMKEGEGGSEIMEGNGEGGLEMANEEHKNIDEQTTEEEGKEKGEEESKDTKTVTGNPCNFSALIRIEQAQDQILDSHGEKEENRESEENKQEELIASSETELREENMNEHENGLEEHQIVSTTDDAETNQESSILEEESGKHDDTNNTEDVILFTNTEVTETTEDPATDVTLVTTGIDEQVNIQNDLCQTSAVSSDSPHFNSDTVVDSQTNQLTSENQDEMRKIDEKNNSESSKQEVEPTNNSIMWQQTDSIEANIEDEGTKEFMKDPMSTSDDILDIGDEANLKVEQPELAFVLSKEQSQTEGRIEETRLGGKTDGGIEETTLGGQTDGGVEETTLGGINQREQEEEQAQQVGVNTLDGGGATMEEEGKTGDFVSELMGEEDHSGRGDKEIQKESITEIENQAMVDPPEPAVQCVEEVPLDTHKDVDLDQVEETFELEEGGKVELDQSGGEVTSDESTTQSGGDLQENPPQVLIEAGVDWGDNLGEQPSEKVFLEDKRGGEGGERAEEAIVGEVEMVEEPVTVLDDEIENIEENQTGELDEQKPATTAVPSEDTIRETKDEGCQRLEAEKGERGKEKDEKKKDENGEEEKDDKPKDDNRDCDINGRVKVLKQAMENGILCPEPQPPMIEGWGSARMLSQRRKDNDWIKADQPEEERTPEIKEWRKELKPVKKDMWETERGRTEWTKKEASPEEKSAQRNEDWIKELKSVIKDESLPRKKDEQVKRKRVVLWEDGHSYIPQREEMTEEKREEVKLISHRRVESPLPPVCRNNTIPQNQDYEISLYVKPVSTSRCALTSGIRWKRFWLPGSPIMHIKTTKCNRFCLVASVTNQEVFSRPEAQ
ncbi:chloride intracellular channel protein 6-like isoform X1, partial [Lates japonicus]